MANGAFLFDDMLIWRPFSNVGYRRILYGNVNYAFRVKMLGPDGKETARTELGKEYGFRFDQLITDASERSSRGMGMIEAEGSYGADVGDEFSGQFLFKPQELFQMEQCGMYRMELEFQVSGPHKNTNEPGYELMRFPPMKIEVEKPLTASFFDFSSTNHGVYVAIIGTKSNGLAGFDDGLQWRVFCENQSPMLESPDLSSGFKMKLQGPDGKDVPRTALGRTIGVNFDALQTLDKLPPGSKLTELNFLSGTYNSVPAKPLPLLKNCFDIKEAGIYALEFQMQLFRLNYMDPGTNKSEDLLRFPPMTIKVNFP